MNSGMIFKDRNEFRKWLVDNHDVSLGIHVVFTKGKVPTYAEALEEALCFGWIDGVVHKIDDDKYTRYFVKRGEKSNWSEKNKKTALELIQKGLMTPDGLKAIKNAKQNGTWNCNPTNEVDEQSFEKFRKLLAISKLALRNFDNMSFSIRRTYVLFYFDAKTESGQTRRLEKIIARLKQNFGPM